MEKNKIKFAFYVSGHATRLQKLLLKNSPVIKNTVLVINDNAPNKSLDSLLLKRKIKYLEIDYKNLDLQGNNKNVYISNFLLQKFIEHKITYCFCFGSRILVGKLLKVYKNKIINFHPSILPMFPGEKSIDQAKKNNTFLLGNTAHFIDTGIDTGPVILQSIIHRTNFFSYDNILDLQIDMIEQIYLWILNKRIYILKNNVHIKGADYSSSVYFPQLD